MSRCDNHHTGQGITWRRQNTQNSWVLNCTSPLGTTMIVSLPCSLLQRIYDSAPPTCNAPCTIGWHSLVTSPWNGFHVCYTSHTRHDSTVTDPVTFASSVSHHGASRTAHITYSSKHEHLTKHTHFTAAVFCNPPAVFPHKSSSSFFGTCEHHQ